MAEQNQENLELTGTQFMYGKPEPLNKDVHGELRYKSGGAPYSKAQNVHLVPLLVGEFAQTMMHYPIIFAGEEKTPLAVMGLAEGQNFFIKDGHFEDGAYVPAYLRRHPFTLASAGEDQFVVCIDRDESGFTSEGEGEALFANGEPTEFTKHAMNFLTEFQGETVRTSDFIRMLTEFDLFEVKNTIFLVNGQQEPVAEYFAIAEERIAELSDEQLAKLVRSGAMIGVYAHLLSLQRWDGLLSRRTQAGSQAGAPAGDTDSTQDAAAKAD
jgi:hypothetical protein